MRTKTRAVALVAGVVLLLGAAGVATAVPLPNPDPCAALFPSSSTSNLQKYDKCRFDRIESDIPAATVTAAQATQTVTVTQAPVTTTVTATATATTTTSTGSGRTYSTNFPGSENPISEGGNWVNGGTNGLDWTNVSTTPGHAIGHQVGPSYSDATALLTGSWAANQRATATVFSTNPSPQENCYWETELRLRSAVTAHNNRGYEVSFKVSSTGYAYLMIVRWNGGIGNYTVLFQSPNAAQWGVKNGDVISGTANGNVITAYKNGVQMAQATDGTWSNGNPGMGFNLENAAQGCSGTNGNYGFINFTGNG